MEQNWIWWKIESKQKYWQKWRSVSWVDENDVIDVLRRRWQYEKNYCRSLYKSQRR